MINIHRMYVNKKKIFREAACVVRRNINSILKLNYQTKQTMNGRTDGPAHNTQFWTHLSNPTNEQKVWGFFKSKKNMKTKRNKEKNKNQKTKLFCEFYKGLSTILMIIKYLVYITYLYTCTHFNLIYIHYIQPKHLCMKMLLNI